MIKYYIDENNNLYANPLNTEGLTEYEFPIWNGKPLPQHKNLDQVQKDENSNYYDLYNEDGTPKLDEIIVNLKKKLNKQILSISKDKLSKAEKIVSENPSYTEDYFGKVYQRKYERAVDCITNDANCDKLQNQADSFNLDVKDYAQLVINMHDLWYDKLDSFIDLIEYTRVKLRDIVNTSTDLDLLSRIKNSLSTLKDEFDDSTTREDIDVFIDNLVSSE